MFQKFASLAGFCHCADQNENAGRQSNQVKQKNKRPEVQSESEQAVDDQIKREQDHSEFLHDGIFVLQPRADNQIRWNAFSELV